MVTLSEDGDDETPLQVKLNGVTTVIGKIGLAFAVLTFLVLMMRFSVTKRMKGKIGNWSLEDALVLLNFFATTVTIIVVTVPEGLPLAVTLSLAFAMKKLMNDKALVRHLSACETMGSAGCICTDKIGTLTTNHMVVHKFWTCGETRTVQSNGDLDGFKSSVSKIVLNILLQSIFQNTGSEVIKGKDGRNTILGSPTEKAILEFGLNLGGDFKVHRKESEILKVEPFNSMKKKMFVLVSIPDKGYRAFCKGASEIILSMCGNIMNADGKVVALSDDQRRSMSSVINGFADEALRTLCLAFKDVQNVSNSDNILEDNYTLIVVVGIRDPIWPGVKEAVKTCLAIGIKVRMVTGDNIHTAKAIARECEISTDNSLAIEGPNIRDKSPQEK